MMNETIRGLMERKSVRAFEPREISREDKETILLAATAAPTAGSQQLYTILDITDQKIKDHLAVSCDNQPFIASAPMVLLFCADYQKWYDAFQSAVLSPRLPGPGELMLSVQDSAIAAQNAVTAAQSLGIGSCYIGDIMEKCEEHRELLGLPEYVFPAIMLVFGYPTQQQKDRAKRPRCELNHIVHTNRYRRMDAAELRAMFQTKAERQAYEDWIAAFLKRKYHSDFSLEMNRSVKEYLKPFLREGEGAK